jgi:hypothetical protein
MKLGTTSLSSHLLNRLSLIQALQLMKRKKYLDPSSLPDSTQYVTASSFYVVDKTCTHQSFSGHPHELFKSRYDIVLGGNHNQPYSHYCGYSSETLKPTQEDLICAVLSVLASGGHKDSQTRTKEEKML